jgi:CheY-like chemotaxis protein
MKIIRQIGTMLENNKSEGTADSKLRSKLSASAFLPRGSSMQPRLGVVLVVEDEWLVRCQIVEALRDAGWHVLETESGEHAVALLGSTQRIDVIFTDIQLAGPLSGWDVGEQGRSVQATMPVIYASGNSADRSRMVVDSLFFDKPYIASQVVEACRRLRRV